MRRVRGLPAMSHSLEPAEDRQAGEVGVVDPLDLEHAGGTDLDAVPFPFAPRVIGDGMECRLCRPTVLSRTLCEPRERADRFRCRNLTNLGEMLPFFGDETRRLSLWGSDRGPGVR